MSESTKKLDVNEALQYQKDIARFRQSQSLLEIMTEILDIDVQDLNGMSWQVLYDRFNDVMFKADEAYKALGHETPWGDITEMKQTILQARKNRQFQAEEVSTEKLN